VLNCSKNSSPPRLARPLSTDDIRQILTEIDRTTPMGVRDAAIILLGYASAMPRPCAAPSWSP
jgi:integrase